MRRKELEKYFKKSLNSKIRSMNISINKAWRVTKEDMAAKGLLRSGTTYRVVCKFIEREMHDCATTALNDISEYQEKTHRMLKPRDIKILRSTYITGFYNAYKRLANGPLVKEVLKTVNDGSNKMCSISDIGFFESSLINSINDSLDQIEFENKNRILPKENRGRIWSIWIGAITIFIMIVQIYLSSSKP
jgi:hypothetical protein